MDERPIDVKMALIMAGVLAEFEKKNDIRRDQARHNEALYEENEELKEALKHLLTGCKGWVRGEVYTTGEEQPITCVGTDPCPTCQKVQELLL